MTRQATRLSVLALGAAINGCALPHHDVALRGNATGVLINYYGDVGETLPLARQHCAQYERVPVLRETKDNNAIYDCVPPSGS